MKNSIHRAAALFLLMAIVVACAKVPITGRRQISLVPESQIMTMSYAEYDKFLGANKPLPDSDPRVQKVRGIGERLAAAATEYLKENKALSRVEGFAWAFNVVDDPTVNAWCMPGGKVVVYTGILPIMQSDEGIALVMGHEIAHAIARHGSERMSQSIAVQGGGLALDVFTAQKPGLASDLFKQSFGIGSQLGMLAYSRNHETEADKMGLVFMAMAGFDPRMAPSFWERMAAASGGQKPPELLSTHPSDDRRINDLNAYMPEAMKYYRPS